MSKGERNGSTRARQQILANAFEAVIGSIYLERGYGDAEKFITKHILSKLDTILESGSWRDPKSHLQEVSQRLDGQTPVYKVLEEVGPDHDKVFTLGVYVGDKLMGQGTGPSKQTAQQKAARAALEAYDKRTKQIDVDAKTV
jgi:ribonuclease-3